MSDTPAPQAERSAGALAELMAGAKALQAVQAQAAIEASRLPNPRLDDPQPGHHFLNQAGEKVGPNGRPIGKSGKELDERGNEVP